MDIETAKQAVRWLIGQNPESKRYHVQFFGGEPMVRYDFIHDLILWTKNQFPQYQWNFGITTNGSLFTDENFTFLKEHKVNILLSVDGKQEIHDRHRKLPNGKGTFNLIEPWFPRLIESGLAPVARLTYTPETLPYLYENIVYLLDEAGFKTVAPTPAVDSYHPFSEKDYKEWDNQYAKIAERFKERISKGEDPGVNYLAKCFRQLFADKKMVSPCGAGRGYLAISHSGGIYPCHRFVIWPEWEMGNVWKGIIKPEIRQQFLEYDINKYHEGCRACKNYFCGGGCLASNYENNKDIRQPSKDGCVLSKKQFMLAQQLFNELKDNVKFKELYHKNKRVSGRNHQDRNMQAKEFTRINNRLDRLEKLLYTLSKVVLENLEGSEIENGE